VAPRRGLPGWVIVLGLVLLANLVVLGVVLTRGGNDNAKVAVNAAPAATVQATPTPTPEPQPTNVLPPPSLPPPQPAMQPSPSSAPAEAARSTVLPSVEYGGARQNAPVSDIPGGRLITPASGSSLPPAAPAATPAPRVSAAALPSAEDLRLSGISLPPLNMALHAWDPQPANRYVMINGQKLREGQRTSDGVEIEQISNEGAVMIWHQQRFVLTPGN
jgi:general secretion pathway protein B